MASRTLVFPERRSGLPPSWTTLGVSASCNVYPTCSKSFPDHRVEDGINTSLKNLGTDYVDLYLMHWPCSTDPNDLNKHLPDWDFVKTWAEMQKLVGTGKVKNIGVSNFGITHLEKLLNDPSCKVSLHAT